MLPGSEIFHSVVARCLATDPADRYPSCRDLVLALEAASSSSAAPAARDSNSAVRANAAPPLWWWRFHQLASIALYVSMLWPIWLIRSWLPDGWSAVTFFAAVVAVAAATTLRMHLWFTSRVYPSEWAEQRERASPWIRLADAFFVALLMLRLSRSRPVTRASQPSLPASALPCSSRSPSSNRRRRARRFGADGLFQPIPNRRKRPFH